MLSLKYSSFQMFDCKSQCRGKAWVKCINIMNCIPHISQDYVLNLKFLKAPKPNNVHNIHDICILTRAIQPWAPHFNAKDRIDNTRCQMNSLNSIETHQ